MLGPVAAEDPGLLRSLAPYLIVIAALLVFAGSINAPFLFDDAPTITHNRRIHDWSLSGAVGALTRNPSRSLADLTFYLNYHFAGTTPYPPYGPTWSYHFINMALHGLNGVLVFLLILGLLRSPFYGSGREASAPEASAPTLIALFAALIFVCHPAQTMAVAYIAQRYALLGAAAFLGCLAAYLRYRQLIEQGEGDTRQAWVALALTLACGACCFVTKENAAVVGLTVLLIELFFWRGERLDVAGFLCLPILYGFTVKGCLGYDPAFEISPSTSLSLSLVGLTAALSGAVLIAFPAALPPGFPGLKGDRLSARSRALSLAAVLAFAGLAIAGSSFAGIEFRRGINMALIMSLAFLIIRLAVRRPGLFPMKALLGALVATAALWLIFRTGDTLDKLFPPSPVYDRDLKNSAGQVVHEGRAHYQYFLTQTRALLIYPRYMALPWGYTAEHAFEITPLASEGPSKGEVVMTGWELLALLGHALVFALAWRCWSRARILSFAIAWYYTVLLVTSSIIPILDPFVEQRMYLPLALFSAAGVVIAARLWVFALEVRRAGAPPLRALRDRLSPKPDQLAPAAAKAWLSPLALAAIVAPALVILPAATQGRVRVWSTEESVWLDAIEKRPKCARAYSSLGMVRLNIAGRLIAEKKPGEAEAYWLGSIAPIDVALQFGPYHVEGWNNLGKAYLELDGDAPLSRRRPTDDRLDDAEDCFKEGVRVGRLLLKRFGGAMGPAVPLCWNNLGLVYRRRALRALPPISPRVDVAEARTNLRKAIGCLNRALKIDPAYEAAWGNLGILRLKEATFEPDANKRQQIGATALQELNQGIKTGRARPSTYQRIASVSVLLGRSQEARQIIGKLAARYPSPEKTRARLLYKLGYDGYQRAVDLESAFPEVRFLARELAAPGDCLMAALEAGHEDQAACLNMTAYLRALAGDNKGALALYERSLKSQPIQADAGKVQVEINRLKKLLGG